MSTLKNERLQRQVNKLQKQVDGMKVMHELDLEQLNTHWATKFDMITGMFEESAIEAGTIAELRSWFKEWNADVNSIDSNDENASEKMADIIQKHGFTFELKPVNVTHNEILR